MVRALGLVLPDGAVARRYMVSRCAVYGFFDQILDDGFFDEFDTIIFYGAGPCGYAATAYSVAAPARACWRCNRRPRSTRG